MRRLLGFAVAMGLSTAVHAQTFSFAIGGHHISITAARNCYRASCIFVSIPGLVTTRRGHSDNVVTAQEMAPAKFAPKAAVNAAAATVAAPARAVQAAPMAPPAAITLPASPPSAPPAEAPPRSQPIAENLSVERPAQMASVTPPPVMALTGHDPAPMATKVVDTERDDTPLGDWQTAGKIGAVRIEACGKALCGYLISPTSQAKAETILINMKANGDTEWRGSIFSRASGNTYHATIALKGANLLHVEACALGHFFCSGNDWTRIVSQPAALVTVRRNNGEPRS
jgi:uncharacterized protein (DUF2147 family)